MKRGRGTCGVIEDNKKTFINDAIKIWNRAPKELKECSTIYTAKKAIKQFSKTVPI